MKHLCTITLSKPLNIYDCTQQYLKVANIKLTSTLSTLSKALTLGMPITLTFAMQFYKS